MFVNLLVIIKCSIKFDKFGFPMKDFLTKQILIRYDSKGDLYPFTQPTTQAFLTISPSLWYQRLVHLVQPIFKHLLYSNSISCNKKDSHIFFHACQLGKHLCLSFDLSKNDVLFPFQVIHSDACSTP